MEAFLRLKAEARYLGASTPRKAQSETRTRGRMGLVLGLEALVTFRPRDLHA